MKLSTLHVILIFLLSAGVPARLHAQSFEIENLRKEIKDHPQQDTFRVNRLNALCFTLPRIEASEMEQSANEALLISQKLNYAVGEGYAWAGKGMATYLSGKREEAFALLRRADSVANRTTDSVLKCWVLIRWSNSYRGYDYRKALSWALKAEELAQTINNKKMLSIAQLSVAEVSRNSSDLGKAMEYLLKAEKSADEANCLTYKVFSWLQLGYLHTLIGEYDKSNEYFEKQADAIQQLGLSGLFASNRLNGIGENYRLTGRYAEALQQYKQALAVSRGLYTKGFIESEIADVYVRTDSLSLAFRYGFSSLAIAREINNVFLESWVARVISQAYLKNKMPDSASYYAQLGLARAKTVGSLEIIRDNTEMLANTYAFTGDFKNAYDYHKEYLHYRDSMMNIEVKNKMAVLDYTYGLTKKQSEIALLNQQKKTQQNLLTAISVILPLFILTALVLFINSKQKTKYLQQRLLLISTVQTQEAERKRIAQDLHDELGAVLSITRMHLVQMQEHQGNESTAKATLQQAQALTESAIATMRRISHELMPPQLEEFGLIKTLRAIGKQINEAKQVKLELVVDDDLPRWADAIELGLYRIYMELINNTLKHAEAGNIIIRFTQQGDQIVGSYSDDGKGLAENHIKGSGFKNIEARINSMSGSFTTGKKPLAGFYASLVIPLSSVS